MIEILNRWTSAVIYHSEKATTMREAVVEAIAAKTSLAGANLERANLAGAYLAGAYLADAYLAGANLAGANLERANLAGANLADAYLAGANLAGANLADAYLDLTILDPTAQCKPVTDEEIAAAGMAVDGDDVIGWRPRRAQHCGSTEYVPGETYEAPAFSVCHFTACHPGLYLAGKAYLRENYSGAKIVRVRCKRCELLHASDTTNGDKWRARRLFVEAEDLL